MDRNEKFGRLLSIANVLSERVFEEGKPNVSGKYLSRFTNKPALALEKIHKELLEYTHKFGPEEWHLFELFGEIMAELDLSDFTNESLSSKYLYHYYSQNHELENCIGVDEASALWGLSPGTIKNYCAAGKIVSKKIGNTWIIDRNQENPKTYGV